MFCNCFVFIFEEKSITDLELQLETRGIQSSHLVSYQKVIDSLLRQIDEITKTLDNVHSERKELAARYKHFFALLLCVSLSFSTE